ncbi:Phosphoglycolate phosphatase, HAD superfamily [Nonomuraea solani]|uniref:Phosphoglycolate phosphatase, HAD superfamily n=1 Tax=Nonomuraea solani TaxID=1144553 RepID=A0A1H6BAF0_9ACTN|nr:haloacid dehalogenase-like hydrolase [Nonomuraea solani]SEG57823.1 Phosphoglycolate phosphatase, HAD superfamily [Nonomuraea solani]
MATNRLVLWDIDHTLIETGGVGREVFADAFAQVTSTPMKAMAAVSGRTELVIFGETLDLHGIPHSDEHFERFIEIQAQGYEERAHELHQRGRALPGAHSALQALNRLAGVAQSVLTGNTRASARAKLKIFGLEQYVDLDIGAYGEDNPIRAHLVAIARDRARLKSGLVYSPKTTVLIGDTPQDVRAGRDGGAHVIGIASGNSSTTDLKAAGADIVFPDLTDSAALIRAVTA